MVSNARRGDVDDVLATIDSFAYEKSILINVGDEKGALLRRRGPDSRSPPDTGPRHVLRLQRAADRQGQGIDWQTREHKTHLEYQRLVPDLMLESHYLG